MKFIRFTPDQIWEIKFFISIILVLFPISLFLFGILDFLSTKGSNLSMDLICIIIGLPVLLYVLYKGQPDPEKGTFT